MMQITSITHADLNDIIFDDRNKAYGAYYMRKAYPKTVWNAFFIATSILLSALFLAFYLQKLPADSSATNGLIEFSEVNLPPKLDPETKVLPPIENKEEEKATEKQEEVVKQKGMDTQKFDKVVADPNADEKATMTADSLFKNKQPGTETTDSLGNGNLGGDPRGTTELPPKKEEKDPPRVAKKAVEPDPFEVHLGTMPIPGNLEAIRKMIGYPREAADLGMEGKVDFKVLVDENGEYEKHITLKRSHPIFEQACAKHLKALKFEPGKMGAQPVKVWVVIPFRFSLNR